MIILGLDPGTATTGYGIIERDARGTLHPIEFGCIQTPSGIEQAARLKQLRDNLLELINKHKPQHAGIEQLFFTNNAKTVMHVSQARGVALEALYSSNILIGEYTPLQVKQAVTGYGKADKMQVQKMVKTLLKLEQIPKPDDAADALAIAICRANTFLPHQTSRYFHD